MNSELRLPLIIIFNGELYELNEFLEVTTNFFFWSLRSKSLENRFENLSKENFKTVKF